MNNKDFQNEFSLENKEYHHNTLLFLILEVFISAILSLIIVAQIPNISLKSIFLIYITVLLFIVLITLKNRLLIFFKDFSVLFLKKLTYKQTKNFVRKEKLEKIDFKNDHNYYRDIIKKYSPAELLYIDEFRTNENYKIYLMTLLNLELKKYILIKENLINVINSDDSNLKLSEKYVMSCIKNGKLHVNTKEDKIYEYVKEEAIKDNLIKEEDKNLKPLISNKKFLILNLFLLLNTLFTPIWFVYIQNKILLSILLIIFIISFLLLVVFFPLSLYYYEKYYELNHKLNNYVRTEEGSRINYKLNGLKNYIKDFSNLDEKDKENINLWEDYLIYSIMFNINNNVLNEMVGLIEIRANV
ncbi:MAG: DUF2207 domain-containing protein [Bacilli bacterium]|nr:DUF2207 domain-containing protein [Bacilli bacterium]